MNWARSSSLWPTMFGLAFCAMEMIATATPRYDIARFGAEIFRASPRQADLMIVSGTSLEDGPRDPPHLAADAGAEMGDLDGRLRDHGRPVRLRLQRPARRASRPLDVYVPGCPPRPESLLTGLITLQNKIMDGKVTGQRERPEPAATSAPTSRPKPHPPRVRVPLPAVPLVRACRLSGLADLLTYPVTLQELPVHPHRHTHLRERVHDVGLPCGCSRC